MKKIIYICDCCKRLIMDPEIGKINMESVDRETYESDGGYPHEDILDPLEFCKECLAEIAQFIDQKCDKTSLRLTKAEGEPRTSFVEPEESKPVQTDEPIENQTKEEIAPVHTRKPRGRGNSSVDTKRILELLEEGVQGKKIAEICDCQPSTVSTVKRIYTLDTNGKVRRKSE